jgi:hypothetical protein
MLLKCGHIEVTVLLVKVIGLGHSGRMYAVSGTSWNRLTQIDVAVSHGVMIYVTNAIPCAMV